MFLETCKLLRTLCIQVRQKMRKGSSNMHRWLLQTWAGVVLCHEVLRHRDGSCSFDRMWDQGHGVTRDVEDRVVEGPKGHSEDDVAAVLGVALQRVVAEGGEIEGHRHCLSGGSFKPNGEVGGLTLLQQLAGVIDYSLRQEQSRGSGVHGALANRPPSAVEADKLLITHGDLLNIDVKPAQLPQGNRAHNGFGVVVLVYGILIDVKPRLLFSQVSGPVDAQHLHTAGSLELMQQRWRQKRFVLDGARCGVVPVRERLDGHACIELLESNAEDPFNAIAAGHTDLVCHDTVGGVVHG
mmetsp:Transcript_109947/g.154184  ORF Transcript_109947/g.154184 Transcript_109947/m.154184 type:complete len:296 (-) Transcript_109947:366-1253(-)